VWLKVLLNACLMVFYPLNQSQDNINNCISAAICRNVIATIDVDTVSFTAAVGSFLLHQPKWWANIQE